MHGKGLPQPPGSKPGSKPGTKSGTKPNAKEKILAAHAASPNGITPSGPTPPSKSVPRDLLDELDGHDDLDGISAGAAVLSNEGLNAKVLVLNRAYAAMRIVSAKRAFCLLARNIAEVIHVEADDHEGAMLGGQYLSYDFASWLEVSQVQRELAHDRYDWVRTVRFDVAVPRIIRVLGYDKLPDSGVKLNRRNLFARDRNRCQYCGRIFPTSELSIDHVLPRAQGGKDTWENLVCACVRCNARKGGRTPEQAHMTLVVKPVRPKRNPLITLRLGQEKYRSWKAFLDHAYWSVELG